MKTLKIEQKTLEDKQYSDYKYSNIGFSQILTLIVCLNLILIWLL